VSIVSVNELVALATSTHADAHTAAMTAVTAVIPTTRRRRGGMSGGRVDGR
jgi:hypothetical protein